MEKEEYYNRIKKIENELSTDRVSADKEYHFICQKYWLSKKYIDTLETQLKKQKEIIYEMKTAVKNDIDGFITINEHGESQEILDLLEIYLEILEDKEEK